MAVTRVLQVVVNMNSGGIENMLMNLYRAIDRDKIQFDFLLHSESKSFFEDEISSLGGKVHRVKPLKLYNLVGYSKALKSFFSQNSYQIIHSHISVWSYFILKIAEASNIPVRIAHSHEAHDSYWDHRLHRVPLIFILKKVINKPLTHRLACGYAAGKWLFGEKQFLIINNSIDSTKFYYDNAESKNTKKLLGLNDKIVFGNVGRFTKQKNHLFLIDIFVEILKRLPNACLLLVGDGSLKDQLETYVLKNNLKDSVYFLGVRSDIPELLSAMDYILMPSFFEGLPVALVEAQASGLKIFASNKISKEADITGLITFLSIADKNIWVEAIMQNIPYNRENQSTQIKTANYDIHNNALFLKDFYIKTLVD